MSVENIKKNRFSYLNELYNVTEANTFRVITGTAPGVNLGFDEEKTRK